MYTIWLQVTISSKCGSGSNLVLSIKNIQKLLNGTKEEMIPMVKYITRDFYREVTFKSQANEVAHQDQIHRKVGKKGPKAFMELTLKSFSE